MDNKTPHPQPMILESTAPAETTPPVVKKDELAAAAIISETPALASTATEASPPKVETKKGSALPNWLKTFLGDLKNGFTPFGETPAYLTWSFSIAWIGFLIYQAYAYSGLLPKLHEIPPALVVLWQEYDLKIRLWQTGKNVFFAVMISCAISYTLAFISVIKFFGLPTRLFQTFRFFGLAGIALVLIKFFEGGSVLVISIMIFFMSTFLTDAMTDVVKKGLARNLVNLGFTLGYSPWKVWYKCAIKSTRFERHLVTKGCIAIVWAMLTTAEGKARGTMTLGNLMISAEKFNTLDQVFAVVAIQFMIGILLDLGYNFYIKKSCRYKLASLERR